MDGSHALSDIESGEVVQQFKDHQKCAANLVVTSFTSVVVTGYHPQGSLSLLCSLRITKAAASEWRVFPAGSSPESHGHSVEPYSRLARTTDSFECTARMKTVRTHAQGAASTRWMWTESALHVGLWTASHTQGFTAIPESICFAEGFLVVSVRDDHRLHYIELQTGLVTCSPLLLR
jgi:hypothetical protein